MLFINTTCIYKTKNWSTEIPMSAVVFASDFMGSPNNPATMETAGSLFGPSVTLTSRLWLAVVEGDWRDVANYADDISENATLLLYVTVANDPRARQKVHVIAKISNQCAFYDQGTQGTPQTNLALVDSVRNRKFYRCAALLDVGADPNQQQIIATVIQWSNRRLRDEESIVMLLASYGMKLGCDMLAGGHESVYPTIPLTFNRWKTAVFFASKNYYGSMWFLIHRGYTPQRSAYDGVRKLLDGITVKENVTVLKVALMQIGSLVSGWSPLRHPFFPARLRRTAAAVLMARHKTSLWLPKELWHHIIVFAAVL